MVQFSMTEEDTFGRPLRFSPEWPPKPEPKAMPVSTPAFSLAFRKAGWPPKTDGDVEAQVGGADSNSISANANSGASHPAPGTGGKPKRAVKDYSSFFAQHAAPPTRQAYVLQPGQVTLPEAFLGGDEETSSSSQ